MTTQLIPAPLTDSLDHVERVTWIADLISKQDAVLCFVALSFRRKLDTCRACCGECRMRRKSRKWTAFHPKVEHFWDYARGSLIRENENSQKVSIKTATNSRNTHFFARLASQYWCFSSLQLKLVSLAQTVMTHNDSHESVISPVLFSNPIVLWTGYYRCRPLHVVLIQNFYYE